MPLLNEKLFTLLALAISALAVVCLLPGLHGGFILDDGDNILRNYALHIRSLDSNSLLTAAYSFQPGHGSRALSMLSFALDFWRGGLDSSVFHSTNIGIHAVSTVALAIFLRALFRAAKWAPQTGMIAALAVTAAWAIHPIQVSSVLYIVQRMQILATLFMILALWAYVRMRELQIANMRSSFYGVLVGLFFVLGFAGKEDALLLPAYTLALELSIFHFRAANPVLSRLFKRGYAFAAITGAAGFLFVFVPNYWHSENYPSRDFNSIERLLTQGRVLLLYIQQTLLPWPSTMPFFYDDFSVSKGWLSPVSTLISWVVLSGLMLSAWIWRKKQSIFSFGVFLFFAGHFLTSNILNLELVFEHRNHLPMIGVLVASCDIVVRLVKRAKVQRPLGIALLACLLLSFGSLTAARSKTWGDPLSFAMTVLRAAPHSERAWVTLAGVYVDRSKLLPGPDLERAIEITQAGCKSVQDATLLLSNLLIYKTVNKSLNEADWDRFLESFRRAPMNPQNRRIVWNYISNSYGRIVMDDRRMLTLIEISNSRYPFTASQNVEAATYIYNKSRNSEDALPYLLRAAKQSPPDSQLIPSLLLQLKDLGKDEWARQIEIVYNANQKQKGP